MLIFKAPFVIFKINFFNKIYQTVVILCMENRSLREKSNQEVVRRNKVLQHEK